MPFPLLLWAFAAMAAGAAAGKGAQIVGDGKANDAEKLQSETNDYLSRRGTEYLSFHDRYIARLITYSAIIRTTVNQVPGVIKNNERPPEVAAFLDRVCAPWGGYFAVKSSEQVFSFSQSEVRGVQSAYMGGRGIAGGNAAAGGAAAAAVWGFTYAQRGISYAMEASGNYDRVAAWAHEATTAIDAQIEELRIEFNELEREFDTAITPRLRLALAPPVDMSLLGTLAGMAEAIEGIALKKQAQLAELMKDAPDE